MSDMSTQKKFVAVLLGGLLLAGAVAVGVGLVAPRDPMLAGYYMVQEGMQDDQVLDLLGPPANEGMVIDPGGGTQRLWWNPANETGLMVWFDADGVVFRKRFVYYAGDDR